ncbi:MAG: ACP phosphodiesterase [Spongiibacteraceae bacterium]
MNYLAHFQIAHSLAPNSEPAETAGLLIGALLGDFIKGPLKGDLPQHWETGIRLHRRIDALTDSHQLVSDCLGLLPPHYRRFGGIMLDVCFDHILSEHWASYHSEPLSEFNQRCYQTVLQEKTHYPAAAQRQIRILAEHDVLGQMSDWRVIERMLSRIGDRFKVATPLGECGPTLAANLPAIQKCFIALYPQLHQQLAHEFYP